MEKVKPQLARLLYVDKALRNGGYPNCSNLAQLYEVSPRTIQRDIDYMKYQLDAPIEYDKARRGYYYTEPNYHLPSMDIRESDFFAICIAEKALEQYRNTRIYDRLSMVFDKIKSYLPDDITVNTSWIDTGYTFLEDSHTMIDPAIWEKITQGLRGHRVLEIRHKKAGGEPEKRSVDPYHIANYRGEWYLIAHCHKRKSVLRFAISRIHEANVTERDYKIPADFDFRKFIGSSFGIMSGDEEFSVRIRFSKKQAPYIRERIWHRDQVISENRDGSIVLSFITNSSYEVIKWVLSWGSEARIIAPESLAQTMEKEIRAMLKLYDH